MKILIVTVAGIASRFNKDFDKPTLKCLYCRKNIQESLLYNILKMSEQYDKFVIVGGYLFDELSKTINEEFCEFASKIELVYNPHFFDFGSMYSLALGVFAAKKYNATEIVFAEGDLFVDKESYAEFTDLKTDVVTINNKPIESDKSVVFYINYGDYINYVYDTNHKTIKIDEAFKAIYNSAQIWKFINVERLIKLNDNLNEDEMKGTNLVLIQKYFNEVKSTQISIVEFKIWYNCNTKKDFDLLYKNDMANKRR